MVYPIISHIWISIYHYVSHYISHMSPDSPTARMGCSASEVVLYSSALGSVPGSAGRWVFFWLKKASKTKKTWRFSWDLYGVLVILWRFSWDFSWWCCFCLIWWWFLMSMSLGFNGNFMLIEWRIRPARFQHTYCGDGEKDIHHGMVTK